MKCTCGHEVQIHNMLSDGPRPGECGRRGCRCRRFEMVDDFDERLKANRAENENRRWATFAQSPVIKWVLCSDPWTHWKFMDHPNIGRDLACETTLATRLLQEISPYQALGVRLQSSHREDMFAVVHRNTVPDQPPWRLSRFDADGPVGHTCRETLAECVVAAERDGYWQQHWVMEVGDERQP